jgi:hypothetical protein
MPILRERNTGSTVNVPEEKVANVLALGYYERIDEAPSKTPAKKASPSKTSK